jgi:hypothetical protein
MWSVGVRVTLDPGLKLARLVEGKDLDLRNAHRGLP